MEVGELIKRLQTENSDDRAYNYLILNDQNIYMCRTTTSWHPTTMDAIVYLSVL